MPRRFEELGIAESAGPKGIKDEGPARQQLTRKLFREVVFAPRGVQRIVAD
jgi:hypothetical protein